MTQQKRILIVVTLLFTMLLASAKPLLITCPFQSQARIASINLRASAMWVGSHGPDPASPNRFASSGVRY